HEYRSGKMQNLSEDEEIAMAELIESKLSAAGLKRYEISNYARPWFHSRHNANYWRSGDYLGLGAGAPSYKRNPDGMTGRRWSNEKNPGRFIAQVSDSRQAVADRDEIDFAKAAGEFMFLGLRMTAGISIEVFRARFGKPPIEFYPRIKLWTEANLLEEQAGYLKLTAKGLMLANSIFVEFM
ncbi:MAG: radical SAM family heme chaperone HemW, partial [Candidatus Binatia bacterium]